ncbi:MAG: 4-alpha-glucanotransferase [Bacteroidales bacterium]
MKIIFNLEYHTIWGQTVYITGPNPELGASDPKKALAMNYLNDGKWSLEVDINTDKAISYHYYIGENDTVISSEWGEPHHIQEGNEDTVLVYDHWQSLPADKPFFSSAFTNDIFSHKNKKGKTPENTPTLTIRCFAPTLRKNESLAICGASGALGNWDAHAALPMDCLKTPEWSVALPLKEITLPCEYKFLVIDTQSQKPLAWENGPNRVFDPTGVTPDQDIVLSGLYLNNPLPAWKGAGIAIPVFSLRSETGYGIGEFTDLRRMVDWAVQTGQRMIQVLPINDTTMTHTWVDSYPYNANSIFALHPVYINLEEVGILKENAKMQAYYEKREHLNKLQEIDYELVTQGKWEYLQDIFTEQGDLTLNSTDYKNFFKQNKDWLIPYAAFCYLRDQNQTASFNYWKNHSNYDKKEIEKLCAPDSPYYREISIHFFIQYHLHKQLFEVRNYAHQNGVVLKGDIPIGISRDSVDAWSDTSLFNMNSQAGAPPDDFSKEGQNWGFPTYNWSEMEKDQFAWWKKRFRKMADYFDAYRIDHILGFFRIWEIPEKAVQGLLGHFNPALPFYPQEMTYFDFWFNQERHATPYIRRYFLSDIFGEYTEEVIEKFLEKAHDDTYVMKKEFDTQKEVENYFVGQNDDKSKRIRNGLYELIADVLFVPDPRDPGKYHPRISAQYTYSYRGLNEQERNAFNRLYDDFFYHRHDDFWRHEAMRKLPPLISSTDMLVCGEDLGMIPHCVPDVMADLQILSLEIQRMPKDPTHEFGIPAYYPYLSVCTTSTHDMSTLRGWWEEDRAKTQRFFNNVLHEVGAAPYFCEPWVCEKIIDQHLKSPSILAIFPLQDWLSMDETIRRENPADERINIPAIPRHYWRYRMHLTLDQLLKADTFNKKVRMMILKSGRDS